MINKTLLQIVLRKELDACKTLSELTDLNVLVAELNLIHKLESEWLNEFINDSEFVGKDMY